jgi:FkbM family methyltransferase
VKSLAFIVKPVLNLVARVLKLSNHNVYYLVSGPLRKEIKEASEQVYAYQHIISACELSKEFELVSNGIVVDVGGGTATTAKIFSEYFPKNKIYVFEPIKASFGAIKSESNGHDNWVLVNKAIGSSIGSAVIHIANRITSSSLLDLNFEKDGSFLSDSLQEKSQETIEITTLDLFLPNEATIEVLKIDVQGFEMEVLKGGASTLTRTKVIVLEVSNHDGYKGAPLYYDLDTFLRNAGFELYDLLPSLRSKKKLQEWDSIYVNKKYIG